MPQCLEIKAKVKNLDEVKLVAASLSASDGRIIKQRDVFFKVDSGRLKLRFLEEEDSQLVFYVRDDQGGPKLSDYSIATISKPEELLVTLGQALGVRGEVRKTRWLYLVGQTRVHCDRVEGLGDFAELEVVLNDDQSTDDGVKIANELMSKLGISESDLITGAYMDLIDGK